MPKPRPEFMIASNMPLNARLSLIGVLAVIGFGLQIMVSILLGWIFVFTAVLMGLLRGKSNEPEMITGGEWKNVTMEELQKADLLMNRAERLKNESGVMSSTSSGGCVIGCLTLLGLGFVAAMLFTFADGSLDPTQWSLAPVAQGGSLGAVFLIDALTLVVPMWLFGNISTWQPPNFKMKLDQLMFIYRTASQSPELDFQPSLLVAKAGEGSVPMDCKLMVKIKDTDPAFMGIQVQTTINKIQGSSYPYTYCVLIAKPEFDLIRKARTVVEMPPSGGFSVGLFGVIGGDANEKKEAKFPRFGGAVVELKREGDVEIAVIRQSTKGTGYKTDPAQALAVFGAALALAKGILSK